TLDGPVERPPLVRSDAVSRTRYSRDRVTCGVTRPGGGLDPEKARTSSRQRSSELAADGTEPVRRVARAFSASPQYAWLANPIGVERTNRNQPEQSAESETSMDAEHTEPYFTHDSVTTT